MNTKICYLYRDAGNYKVHNECVIQGELSKEQIQSILDCCDMGEYFIPRQVGMPERRFNEYDTEVDHCWFEISEDGFERTNQPANIPLTARQLVENFALRKDNWDDTEWMASETENKKKQFTAREIADVLVREGTSQTTTGRWSVGFEEIQNRFGLDLSADSDAGRLIVIALKQEEEINELIMTEDHTTIRYLNIMDDELIEASQEFYAKHSALYGVKELL